MANYEIKRSPISQATEELTEARAASDYAYRAQLSVQRAWDAALVDGQVDAEEIQRITALQASATRQSGKAFKETAEALPVLEHACVFLETGLTWALTGKVTKNAADNAATVGIDVGVLTAAGD